MRSAIKSARTLALVGAWAWAAACVCAADKRDDAKARAILEATGVKGGLVVHIGCGDGRLTAALRANDRYIVHGLDTDAANVERARDYVWSRGLWGQVTVERWDGKRLPYTDNLVNLVVWQKPGDLSMNEVRRVLAPNGVAYIKVGRKWTKSVKPRPKDIDEWTHYLHDATNNAVAHDSVVGPPRHVQWVGSPKWARHHDHMASMSALVSAGGRVFYIFDEGPTASIELPSKWSLIARDAFSGVILWKRPIKRLHTQLWPLKSGPAQLTRRLVAVGDTVYVTLGLGAPLTALDAATGRTIRTYEGTKSTEEVIASDGVLFVVVNPGGKQDTWAKPSYESVQEIRARARDWSWQPSGRRVMAIQADTGETLWQKESPVVPLTLAADRQRVYFHDGERIVCLDRRTGDQLWASAPLPRWETIRSYYAPTLVVYRDVVLFAGGDTMVPHRGSTDTMTALSARTGEVLWTSEHPPSGYQSPEDILVAGGLVWCAATTSGGYSGIFTGRDPMTGEVRSQFPPDVETYWFHHRCYRAKATDRYLLTSRTGIEFIDFRAKHWMPHHWVRGGCLYGIMPCNGLIYAPPHSCACYMEAKQFGFNALAPEPESRAAPPKVSDEGRLQRGPAYDEPISGASAAPDDWPTYRHDSTRSGFTPSSVPAELERAWQADFGARLSPLVVAGGKVFVASVDHHTVHALDAASGRPLWHYTASGRVDSPPTIYQESPVRVSRRLGLLSASRRRRTDMALPRRPRGTETDGLRAVGVRLAGPRQHSRARRRRLLRRRQVNVPGRRPALASAEREDRPQAL
ncbi:MAG: PQQ-binding-like beta-propeller repeat protein [Armatimonadota bacterium]